ncbi:hypothetical protein [Agarilytica rhodophyticola]|uniref:hypothetical protein n=1 Tax=Agarilytica rhodophyticola TaxID=1737490 RepID=UPI000B341CA3|nr:hypothetical protein [Agarilytica rhodophyticola]
MRKSLTYILEHPKWAGIGGFVGIAGLLAAFLPMSKNEVIQVQGLYSGHIEGGTFELCLVQNGTDVRGVMSFPGSPKEYSVDYKGLATETEVRFTWDRFANHPNGPDSGLAVMAPADSKNTFSGYWESKEINFNRQEWNPIKIKQDCELFMFSG